VPSQTSRSIIPAFLRDVRVIQVIGQVLFVIIVLFLFSQLVATIGGQLEANNLVPNFAFLQNRAGFGIGESPAWYSGDSTYLEAFQVGVANTLRVVVVGLILSTVVGVLFGIFLLSTNWLIRTIARVYVEILRNTPLLVQLFVFYYVVMFSLPTLNDALTIPNEGVLFLPLRLLLYVVLWFGARRALPHNPADDQRRVTILTGIAAAAAVTEAAFWLVNNVDGWQGVYGAGALLAPPFLLYVGVSLALLAMAGLALPARWRPLALGAAAGQFTAGVLFYLGMIPAAALRFEVYPWFYVSIRGFVIPETLVTARFPLWMAFVGLGLVVAGAIWVYGGRVLETSGRAIPRGRYALLALVGFTVIGWLLVSAAPPPQTIPLAQDGQVVPVPLDQARADGLLTAADEQLYNTAPLLLLRPERQGLRFRTGTAVSPEYMALLLGLVVYTSAFIAEIVRAGIQAVSYGQIEAARALGLKTNQVLTVVILPQALRVIIPPLGNQYLNLAKNSSLGLAIAFADLFQVTSTIMNQSGQSITGITMVMISYLLLSLVISGAMNWLNARFRLVTR
jgi:His/Glu/Gln/Arg/opine family amino acid ABC transporter permease subunit